MHCFQPVSLSERVLNIYGTAFWVFGWSGYHWHQCRLCPQAGTWELQIVFDCSNSGPLTWIRQPLPPPGCFSSGL